MSARPIAKFLHFGLPKCGSTFLQSVWGEDRRYTGADLTATAQVSRQLAAKGQTINLPRMDFSVKAKPGTTLIGTSEGFTWAFLGRPHLLGQIRALHQIGAAITGATGASDTALFMIRNPADWIRAAHEQTIKEGGWMSGSQFLTERRELIDCVLDLKHIYEAYSCHFKRVVFLSADEMRHDPASFWARYTQVLGAPAPDAKILDKVTASNSFSNRSLKENTAKLARLNRLFSCVGDAWRTASGMPAEVLKERELILPKYDLSRVWAARRTAEALVPEEFDALLGGAFMEMETGFSDLELDHGVKDSLRAQFCDVVEAQDTIPDTLKAEYRASLD